MHKWANHFQAEYQRKIGEIQALINQMEERHQRGVVWGAGAKGVTLLNTLKPDPDVLGLVVDINPNKQGKFVPGTGQPIVAPDYLVDYRPDVIMVMNPNYEAEIRQTIVDLGLSSARVVSI